MIYKFYILIIILLLFTSCAIRDKRGKVPILNETVENTYLTIKSDYTNAKILKDIKGSLYVLNKTKEYEQVMIKWDNGFMSLGIMNNEEKELGRWYLYDKKGRLIKYIVYSENGNTLYLIDKFNKKGQLISRNSGDAFF